MRHQLIDEDDIQAVVEVLKSDFLTQGPKVREFEERMAEYARVNYAVAVSNGTAALHCAYYAADVDYAVVPALTFAATANALKMHGGTPVFADVDPKTLCLTPEYIKKTDVIVSVDFAGYQNDIQALKKYGLVISDACHSMKHNGADMTVFSFHPVKLITTGEGGMVVTDDRYYYKRMVQFRDHGRIDGKVWDIGMNYRMTDFQAALGISQLKKVKGFLQRRQEIAELYSYFIPCIQPFEGHTFHFYPVKVRKRDEAYQALKHIGVNIHYRPLHFQPLYEDGYSLPNAEAYYETCLSLPTSPNMTDEEIGMVIKGVSEWR